MQELFTAAVSVPNLLPTLLLIFLLIYWLVVLVGAIDVDSIDVDLDLDAGVDGELSGMSPDRVLAYFNLGQVPLMVFLTFWILPVWVLSVLGNYYFGNTSWLVGLLILIPSMVVGLFVAKRLTAPLVSVYLPEPGSHRVGDRNDVQHQLPGKPKPSKAGPVAEVRRSHSAQRANLRKY